MHQFGYEEMIKTDINPKIIILKDRLINFHLLYVKNFESILNPQEFNNFRLTYLNKIRTVCI
jgi:hypothetical protein